MLPVLDAVQVAAGGADEDVFRVPPVFGQEIAGEEVEIPAAVAAVLGFYPKEVFDVGFPGAAFEAGGAVERADLLFESAGK
jgi:hypothetical protein